MFGWTSVPLVGSCPETERRPPPAPTPLEFPAYKLSELSENDSSESSLGDIYDLLGYLRRPQDISLEKLKALNLKVETDIPAECIVRRDDAESVPPFPWQESTADPAENGERPLTGNGNPYPLKERYEGLKTELLLDNDDAFREVSRLPPREGGKKVRVTQARKFWVGLDRAAQYWDTSLDNYYERPATSPQTPKEETEDKMQMDDETQPSETQDQSCTAMDVDKLPTTPTSHGIPPNLENEGEVQQATAKKYTGRRTGAGHEMPEEIREETVRALVEMAAWPFGCQVTPPGVQPRLAVKSLLFPVRQSFVAARSPKDRQLARSGIIEGPVFVGQCRAETFFRGPEDAPGSGNGELCDLFRELGVMLLAAQERAREGTTEVKPGEGKWWAETPRWGGAPNNLVGDKGTVGESIVTPENGSTRKRSKYEHPLLTARRGVSSRKLSSSEKWELVQPGPSLWDRRMRYMQLGKNKESPFDDIYMLSSINHHVAILHLRIHRRYLEVLTAGGSDFPPESDTQDQPWYVLKLRRTKWYDLFDAQQRLEVFQGIWSVFHYLLRKT